MLVVIFWFCCSSWLAFLIVTDLINLMRRFLVFFLLVDNYAKNVDEWGWHMMCDRTLPILLVQKLYITICSLSASCRLRFFAVQKACIFSLNCLDITNDHKCIKSIAYENQMILVCSVLWFIILVFRDGIYENGLVLKCKFQESYCHSFLFLLWPFFTSKQQFWFVVIQITILSHFAYFPTMILCFPCWIPDKFHQLFLIVCV